MAPSRSNLNLVGIDAIAEYAKPDGMTDLDKLPAKLQHKVANFCREYDGQLGRLWAFRVKRIAGARRALLAQMPFDPEATGNHQITSKARLDF